MLLNISSRPLYSCMNENLWEFSSEVRKFSLTGHTQSWECGAKAKCYRCFLERGWYVVGTEVRVSAAWCQKNRQVSLRVEGKPSTRKILLSVTCECAFDELCKYFHVEWVKSREERNIREGNNDFRLYCQIFWFKRKNTFSSSWNITLCPPIFAIHRVKWISVILEKWKWSILSNSCYVTFFVHVM